MARQTTPLSAAEVKNAKPKSREFYLVDGLGLKLRILPSGNKNWLFNYIRPTNGKRTNLNIGRYPDVSLQNARKKAFAARELIAMGIDPKDEETRVKLARRAEADNTFLRIASDWFDVKKDRIKPDTATDIWRSLERHILPEIANMPITAITAPRTIELLKPIEARGTLETVKRLTQRLNEIMTFATNSGLIHANPLTGIKAAFKKPKKQNMLTIAPDELPEFMRSLYSARMKFTTQHVIEWQLHTMTRPNESTQARWSEIDFETSTWILPPEKQRE